MHNFDEKGGNCHLNSIFLLNIQMYTLPYQAPLIVTLRISYAPRKGRGIELLSVNLITGCSDLNCTYYMPQCLFKGPFLKNHLTFSEYLSNKLLLESTKQWRYSTKICIQFAFIFGWLANSLTDLFMINYTRNSLKCFGSFWNSNIFARII